MITKRIIPCLDVRDGRVVKGTNFKNLHDVSSPVELGKFYSDCGADELVFYDITASGEERKIFTDILKRVAENVFIPLTVGGGISTLSDFERVLSAGADKVSVNSGAIKNPNIIYDAARRYGDQCVVLSVDVRRVENEFRIFAKGGREDTGIEALSWIKRGVESGAGEIVVNSIDTDGVKHGFDIEMLREVVRLVNVPVIASGGAGCIQDFIDLFKKIPEIDAGLAASVFHFGEVKIKELKERLLENNINVRI
jgi:cyclase